MFIISLLIVCCFHYTAFGGSAEKPLRFFNLSYGYRYHYLRDNGMSPLIYQGSSFNFKSGFEKRKPESINQISYLFDAGRLKPLDSDHHPSYCINLGAEIEYTYLRILKKYPDNNIQIYLGGTWNVLAAVRWHKRYVNNALNYEFVTSLAPKTAFSYDFKIKKVPFRLWASLTLPVFSFYVRPSYASSLPEGFIGQEVSDFKAFWKSGNIATINKMLRIIYLMNVEYLLSNNNRLSLEYSWDYYRIGSYNKVKAASHNIMLGWMFNF